MSEAMLKTGKKSYRIKLRRGLIDRYISERYVNKLEALIVAPSLKRQLLMCYQQSLYAHSYISHNNTLAYWRTYFGACPFFFFFLWGEKNNGMSQEQHTTVTWWETTPNIPTTSSPRRVCATLLLTLQQRFLNAASAGIDSNAKVLLPSGGARHFESANLLRKRFVVVCLLSVGCV